MKIGIICAGDDELAPFLPLIKNCKITEKAMLKFYEGQINGMEIVALFSGVCKVNAAIASQNLIDCFHIDMIINSGTAGGIHPDLKVFDTVISTKVCYHDVNPDILTEFHPWMKSVFFESDPGLIELSRLAAGKIRLPGKVVWGCMATGESFITNKERKRIQAEFSPLTVDMETAAIAHCCYVNKIPFISIRCITDTASHSGTENFEANCSQASIIAKELTVSLLNELSCKLAQK